MNYPRVEGADPEKILAHLNALVGKPLEVRVLNVDEGGKKIIFSEKATVEDRRKLALGKLKEGDIVEGQVSGILSYGLFVTFDGLEGLVHVSEVDWGHVADPSKFAKVGDKVTVQVIGVDTDKISLSMKRLKENPWDALAKQFHVGDVVEVPVTKISKFGVFVEMTGGINGLIHLSEITHEVVANPADHVKMGEVVKAKIIALDTKEKRIGLSLKALVPAPVPVVEEGVTTEKNENDLLGEAGDQLKAAEKAVAKEDDVPVKEAKEKVEKKAATKKEETKKAPAKKDATETKITGYYKLWKSEKSDDFYFSLNAGNHEVILASQGYDSKEAAEVGIASVQKNGVDEGNFEHKTAKDDSPFFSLNADGKIIGKSEMYSSEAACKNGVASVMKNAASTNVKEL